MTIDENAVAATAPAARLAALQLARSGQVYDLSSGWFRGMPGHPAHPNFDVVTYRTPRGQQLHRDLALVTEDNEVGFGFVSELLMGTAHTGTHVDARCHVVVENCWNGGSVEEGLGDFGALDSDATELPHLINRGVLLDVPTALGHDVLPAHFPIGPDELEQTCRAQGVEITPGTVVLIRTGQMAYWPDAAAMAEVQDAGINLAGAQWLVERGAIAIGADTATVECAPTGIPGNPHAVHIFLIREHGLPILEWVWLEQVARERVHEFLFIALPLRVRGATGSMLAPVAIV